MALWLSRPRRQHRQRRGSARLHAASTDGNARRQKQTHTTRAFIVANILREMSLRSTR